MVGKEGGEREEERRRRTERDAAIKVQTEWTLTERTSWSRVPRHVLLLIGSSLKCRSSTKSKTITDLPFSPRVPFIVWPVSLMRFT